MARQDKRQQIMQAAERLFTSRRFHEITLDDVARTAKVGKGTIYRHFRDKDDLFFQTATSGFDELCELLRRQVPAGASFFDQLTEACMQISRFFEQRRQLFRMMQTEEGRMQWCGGSLRDRWLERRKGLVSAVAEILAKGVAEGQVRADIPPEVLAHLLLGLLRTRARDLSEVAPADCGLALVMDVFYNGVCRRGAGGQASQGTQKDTSP
ncbi:MAG TPA: TetR/AcrR family transcriptional regulator [Phycisphaerae bacterium]|nr:TetR/AcrR family transcriptional regulator [Phycisphaerae bacterium]